MTTEVARTSRILLIDDDSNQRALSTIQLSEAGYDVAAASDARGALEQLRRSKPDAIVCDVVMQPIDGFSFCRIVRGDAGLASLPVMLISARFLDDEDQVHASEVGADVLLRRTPTFELELTALRGLLNQR